MNLVLFAIIYTSKHTSSCETPCFGSASELSFHCEVKGKCLQLFLYYGRSLSQQFVVSSDILNKYFFFVVCLVNVFKLQWYSYIRCSDCVKHSFGSLPPLIKASCMIRSHLIWRNLFLLICR